MIVAFIAIDLMVAVAICYVVWRRSNADTPQIDSHEASQAVLPPIPDFSLESLEPVVADQIRAALAALDADPNDASANGRLGMLFQTYELYRLAEPCYRRVVMLAPGDVRWHHYLGLVLVANGDPSAAAAEFDHVLAKLPDDVPALLERAGADLARNDLDAAARGYGRVIELRPDAAEAYCGTAQVLLKRGDAAGASAQLAAALRLVPKYGKARYVLGQALRKLGRVDEAAEQLRLAEEQKSDIPHVHDPLRQELANLAVGAVETLHHATERLEAGDLDEAIRLFEQSLRLNPNLAETHANLGAALLKKDQLDRSAVHLRRAVELDSNYLQARYNLGVIAHRRKAFVEAVEHFRAVLAIRTDHFETQYGIGADLVELGQLDEAAAHLRAAIALRPQDARPYRKLADALSGLGRYGESIAVCREASQRLPEDATISDRLAWLLATCPQDEWRDPAEAVRLAEDVCRITKERVPRALDTLAAAYASAGRFDDALAAATKALDATKAKGDDRLATGIERRMELYRAELPYRASTGAANDDP